MRVLLDTNALLLWSTDRLPADVAATIEDPDTAVYVSAACLWEIAIKAGDGRLTADPASVERAVHEDGFTELPITFRHVRAAGALPLHHRDPFDRIMVAQAQVEQLTIVTRDRKIADYEVALLRC